MDGAGLPSLSPPNKEDDLSRVPLVDAPILLFVCFHKAFRAELHQLRALAETAPFEDESRSRELILKLQRRFQFLKLALKYHCAVEDEVIFLALDAHVKNVVCTYSIEHSCTDDLFNSIFRCLDELSGLNENISKLFQELVYCIGILQNSISQHMLKEEEQVFTLRMQKFSTKEQASLVWQFICSVPVMLLEEVLPWMVSLLSVEKQTEVTQCLSEIAPKEKTLQESEEVQGAYGSLYMKKSLGLSSSNRNLKEMPTWMKANGLELEDGVNQVNVLHHDAIKKDMKEILEELYLIRNSSCFQNLDSILI